jgi:hypothetical protein
MLAAAPATMLKIRGTGIGEVIRCEAIQQPYIVIGYAG